MTTSARGVSIDVKDGKPVIGLTCQTCGASMVAVGLGPATPGIVARMIFACSKPKCAGRYVLHLTLRTLKPHQEAELLEAHRQTFHVDRTRRAPRRTVLAP